MQIISLPRASRLIALVVAFAVLVSLLAGPGAPRAAAIGPGTCTISGYVTDAATGKPVAGLSVTVYPQGPEMNYPRVTDANGYFEVADLADGYYDVAYADPGYNAPQPVDSFYSPTSIGVSTAAGEITDASAQISAVAGVLQGTVKVAGKTASGLPVNLYSKDGAGTWVKTGTTYRTGAGGAYSIRVAPGDYRVGFGEGVTTLSGARYFSAAAGAGSTATSVSSAATVTVVGAETSIANASLASKSSTLVTPTSSRVRKYTTIKYKVQVYDQYWKTYVKSAPVKVYRSTNGGKSYSYYKTLSTGTAGYTYLSYKPSRATKIKFSYAGVSGSIASSYRIASISIR